MEPILNNERAKKEWNYILSKVGERNALDAINKLPGNRKPFPFNIAKCLGLELPPEEALPMPEQELKDLRTKGRPEIEKLKKLLA